MSESAQRESLYGIPREAWIASVKVAKHGPGRRVFLIEFRYEAKRQPITPARPSDVRRRVRRA